MCNRGVAATPPPKGPRRTSLSATAEGVAGAWALQDHAALQGVEQLHCSVSRYTFPLSSCIFSSRINMSLCLWWFVFHPSEQLNCAQTTSFTVLRATPNCTEVKRFHCGRASRQSGSHTELTKKGTKRWVGRERRMGLQQPYSMA